MVRDFRFCGTVVFGKGTWESFLCGGGDIVLCVSVKLLFCIGKIV